MLKRKYDNYKVYIHNLSYFDSIFLVDTLTKLGKVDPLIRDNKFLKTRLKYSTKNDTSRKCILTFYDSMLILQSSLRDLGKGFNVDVEKGFFPFGFMNFKEVDFNYRGSVPKRQDFLGTISSHQYEKYCEKYMNID
jgi:hypothetical protein